MARPVWRGSVSFGLVSVPVKAYTAVRDNAVRFHQIERETGARIKQQLVSSQTGEVVERDDLAMGYEVAPGRHVVFERDEIAELRPASTKAIDVTAFVELDDVDPIHYERTYWLGPDGDAADVPYHLLLQAMEDRRRVAIGCVVMRNKQYLAAIRPLDGLLAMSTMRFADDLVAKEDIPELPAERPEVEAKALTLATQIVDSLTEDWDPSQYHDTFATEVREMVEARAAGAVVEKPEEPERRAEVVDLMAALRASLAAAKGEEPAGETEADDADDAPAKAKRAPAKKAAGKKAPAKKAPAKKAAAKKAPAKKAAARKSA